MMKFATILSLLLCFASSWAAGPKKPDIIKPAFSFAFGHHTTEKIEFFQKKISGKNIWVGRYLVGDRVYQQRAFPKDFVNEMGQSLQKILDENKADLKAWEQSCAARFDIILPSGTKTICSDSASVLAQTRLSEWIREAQRVLEVR